MLGVILQIIPANGTKAVFAEHEDMPSYFRKEVVCFALCECEGDDPDGNLVKYREVKGITTCGPDLSNPDDAPNFLGYEDPGETLDWEDKWYDWRGYEEERLNNYHMQHTVENLN